MGLIFAAVVDVNQLKERLPSAPFFPLFRIYYGYAVCSILSMLLSHFMHAAMAPSLSLSSYYNVSPASFHGQYFCAVVAAKRFMPLSSVVHALISLSG